jgi:predicted transposase/invertase (TIGR01784 family)
MISEQINFGDDFDKIERVISIVIAGETLIQDSPNYHHRFTLYDPKADVEFTDLIEIHTIELMKLPTNTDGTALYDWAKFIAYVFQKSFQAETEEELDMVAERNPQIKQAAVKLRVMSADERARDMLERRIKGERDLRMWQKDAMEKGLTKGRAEGLAEGLEKGRIEGLEKGRTEGLEKGRTEGLEKGRTEGVEKERVNIAANLLKINMPKDQIAEITGLTLAEIDNLTD